MSAFCPVCGSPKHAQELYCDLCEKVEQDEYVRVRNYLRAFPKSNAMQVANATGVPVHKITRLIREGAITVISSSSGSR